MRIRRMHDADVVAAQAMAAGVLPQWRDAGDRVRRARAIARIRHLLASDADGALVAEHDGRIVGMALALRRDGLWGLSLLAVALEHHGRGIGRRLLEPAWSYGAGCRGHLVVSSESPAAMRLYAALGLGLRPCVSAAGIVDRGRLRAVEDVHDAGWDGVGVAHAIGAAVRGSGHGPDLPLVLRSGARLLLFEDRAFALLREGEVMLLAGRDEASAERVLWASLGALPAGATAHVGHLTAGQDWAVRACLEAGLELSPDGPLFAGGELGPLRPYVPSGAYL